MFQPNSSMGMLDLMPRPTVRPFDLYDTTVLIDTFLSFRSADPNVIPSESNFMVCADAELAARAARAANKIRIRFIFFSFELFRVSRA